MSWFGSPHYAPYFTLPPAPRRAFEAPSAQTPLLHDAAPALAGMLDINLGAAPSAQRTDYGTKQTLNMQAPNLGAPNHVHDASVRNSITMRLQAQVDYATKRYTAGQRIDAAILLRSAADAARQHHVSRADLFDTGGLSPLYVSLLYKDTETSHAMTDGIAWPVRSDINLILCAIACRNAALVGSMCLAKLPPAPSSPSETDAIVPIVAALFATGDKAFVAQVLHSLLRNEDFFASGERDTWHAAMLHDAADQQRGPSLLSADYVQTLLTAPRSKVSQPARVHRRHMALGFSAFFVRHADAVDAIAILPRSLQRRALAMAMSEGLHDVSRALLAACEPAGESGISVQT